MIQKTLIKLNTTQNHNKKIKDYSLKPKIKFEQVLENKSENNNRKKMKIKSKLVTKQAIIL